VSGDVHARFWESAGVRFPRATHLPLDPHLPGASPRTAALRFSQLEGWLRAAPPTQRDARLGGVGDNYPDTGGFMGEFGSHLGRSP